MQHFQIPPEFQHSFIFSKKAAGEPQGILHVLRSEAAKTAWVSLRRVVLSPPPHFAKLIFSEIGAVPLSSGAIHELVTKEYLSEILLELKEDHKELLFLWVAQLFSSTRIAASSR